MLALLCSFALAVAPETIHLTVDGMDREALVFQPAKSDANPPVVFGFHGHGGSARQASRSFDLQDAWPEAVVVYPLGLATKTRYDPAGRLHGWEPNPSEDNKDVRFVDALYKKVLADYHGDSHHVFAMGHSNGAQFMYILWTLRGSKFAGFGSCEGSGGQSVSLTPKPFFITIGDEDKLVPPALQHRSLDAVFKVEASAANGSQYGEKGTLYAGKQPVVLWAYHGGHAFPKDCIPTMVKFFKGVHR